MSITGIVCFILIHMGIPYAGTYPNYLIKMVYYEQPPFIYRDSKRKLIGIVPDIIDKVMESCNLDLSFSVNARSEKNFTSLMEDPKAVKNYTNKEKEWIWLSLLTKVPPHTLRDIRAYEFTLFHSPGIEVVVHRDQIGIFSKILVGLNSCYHLFVIIFLLTLIFGIVIWFIECWKNPKFEKSIFGCGIGMWMCLVTLTTVGYEDFTPKTIVGDLKIFL